MNWLMKLFDIKVNPYASCYGKNNKPVCECDLSVYCDCKKPLMRRLIKIK